MSSTRKKGAGVHLQEAAACIAGNIADVGIAHLAIKRFSRIALSRIENEQTAPGAAGFA